MTGPRKKLAIFDLSVKRTSPAGSCVLAEIEGLLENFEIVLFSDACEVRPRSGFEWKRVWLPERPIALRYWLFVLVATARYALWRAGNEAPSAIQTTQGQILFADVSYAHFCHRAYLRNQWKSSSATGLRRLARWINHQFNALTERVSFRVSKSVIVPSRGLARELAETYPDTSTKIRVMANPVDLDRFLPSSDFDRVAFRSAHQLPPTALIFAFLALGDFARKGLDIVIEAVTLLSGETAGRIKILVIGGRSAEIEEYKRRARASNVEAMFVFVGLVEDPRRFLWCADVFLFPSAYEIFSLAILQAAAAGLPIIVKPDLYGAEEFLSDGRNGWGIQRSPKSVAAAIEMVCSSDVRLAEMSEVARESVRRYGLEKFHEGWNRVYLELTANR